MRSYIIDVREPEEYARGHVENALNIPPSTLLQKDAMNDIPKDAPIILYCVSGSRSNVAKHILEEQGYTNVQNGINKDHVTKMLAH